MIRSRAALALAVLLASAVALADEPALVNASFETPGPVPAGWNVTVGAKSGDGTESLIALDRSVARDGAASVRLSGDAATGTWRMLSQSVACAALDRVTVRAAGRCRGLSAEGRQFRNANAILAFEDATGRRTGIFGSAVLDGDRDWAELVVDAIAPPGSVKAHVGLLSSMTGTVWFDDVRVAIGPATADDAAGRARAFDALADQMRRTYPFFGFAGRPAADALFAAHRARCVEAADAPAFLDAVHAMLAQLNDVHVTVDTATGRRPTAAPDPRPANFNPVAMQAALTEKTAYEKNLLLAGRIGAGKDAIGYVAIGTFQLDEAALGRVLAAIDRLADAKALILDVRPNGGGDERSAARIAGRFTKEPVLYARQVFRNAFDPSTAAFTAPGERTLAPVAPFDPRPVVVLQGPSCVSSTEGFLMMMRVLPNVTTIGQNSRGASANPAPFELLPGVRISLSRWRALTPDGDCIEGKGLAPKIVVDASHEHTDPTLERAIAELRH